MSQPIQNRTCRSLDRNKAKMQGIAFVVLLFLACGPSTIFRAVWSIDINTVQRVSTFWANTHISQKVFVQSPSITDENSSASVVMEKSVFGIPATAKHVGPGGVFPTQSAPTCMTMSDVGLPSKFAGLSSETPTRLRISSFNALGTDVSFDTAITFAGPFSFYFFSDDDDSSKTFADSAVLFHS